MIRGQPPSDNMLGSSNPIVLKAEWSMLFNYYTCGVKVKTDKQANKTTRAM